MKMDRVIFRHNDNSDYSLAVNGQVIGQFKTKPGAEMASERLNTVLSMIDVETDK